MSDLYGSETHESDNQNLDTRNKLSFRAVDTFSFKARGAWSEMINFLQIIIVPHPCPPSESYIALDKMMQNKH